MKPPLSILLAIATLASATAHAQGAPSVETLFANPKHFTDFRVERGRGRGSEGLADELRRWMEREAPRHLPAGAKLTVTITDVDMAGEFEPWRNANTVDVRVVRDIYPARVSLAFRLADGDGTLVAEGERKLMSTMVASGALRLGDGPLGYEKALLRDWLAREFDSTRGGPRPAGR